MMAQLWSRKTASVFMLAGLVALPGCTAMKYVGRGFYDREAYRQCDKEPTPDARRACYDRLDEARRQREFSSGKEDDQ